MTAKKMMYFKYVAICIALVSLLMAGVAKTADAQSTGTRITQKMKVIAAHELMAGQYPIRLWGVHAAKGFSPYALKALQKLQVYANRGEISCRLISKERNTYLGKCFAFTGEDIAVSLLEDGLASVDRRAVSDDASANIYLEAEQKAAQAQKGIWADVSAINVVTSDADIKSGKLAQDQIILMIVVIVGFLAIGFVIRSGFRSIEKRHQQEQAEAMEREGALQDRERGVLASAMIGELEENKAKIEAFMRIYEAQLAEVSQTQQPKYQQAGGDSVAQYPVLNHTVFEANSARLSLLGMKMAGDVSRLYSMFHKEAGYINLEADMPQHQAVDILTRIVSDARSLLPQINQLVGQLNEMR